MKSYFKCVLTFQQAYNTLAAVKMIRELGLNNTGQQNATPVSP